MMIVVLPGSPPTLKCMCNKYTDSVFAIVVVHMVQYSLLALAFFDCGKGGSRSYRGCKPARNDLSIWQIEAT